MVLFFRLSSGTISIWEVEVRPTRTLSRIEYKTLWVEESYLLILSLSYIVSNARLKTQIFQELIT